MGGSKNLNEKNCFEVNRSEDSRREMKIGENKSNAEITYQSIGSKN